MTKKARKRKAEVFPGGVPPTKQQACSLPPTKTPHEIMAWCDAENMVKLLHELISFMPGTFRSVLQAHGFLQFKVADYDVLITDKKRFEKNNATYGKVVRQ
ncbi:hypothetical protein LCGC14_0882100 [marine sediment metagenome]|uniref:Uncharacterized protein n=1 Tax=marine sediment metagenome TaxID=412755 RepID=A0A0F9QWA4_9ZZZZ